MIKVRDRTGKEHDPGIQMAEDLIHRRIPEEGLTAVLGNNQRARLRQIILNTGGYPREILQLLQELLLSDDFPVSDMEFRRAMNIFTDPFENMVYNRNPKNWVIT